jgi:hypothetical protein
MHVSIPRRLMALLDAIGRPGFSSPLPGRPSTPGGRVVRLRPAKPRTRVRVPPGRPSITPSQKGTPPMPTIVVRADQDGDSGPPTLTERVITANLGDKHYAAQLIERLTWATLDAENLEQTSAHATASSSDAQPRPRPDRAVQRDRESSRPRYGISHRSPHTAIRPEATMPADRDRAVSRVAGSTSTVS